jgi:thioredoxin reductase
VDFDVAIVGGGPAGRSAAGVLGRACRRVIVLDHGKPRNHAAQGVHCYLGLDGVAPHALRDKGRNEALAYGVQIVDEEVDAARCLPGHAEQLNGFVVTTKHRSITIRALLLCTGVVDVLPDIDNIRDFYGVSVHHCPYCDGWEHRDQSLAALGSASSVVELAHSLRTWSGHVTACLNGHSLTPSDRESLEQHDIQYRTERVRGLRGSGGQIAEILFEAGPPLACDAVFFSSDQTQRSALPQMLGCELNCDDQAQTGKKQKTNVLGLFLAGDADGDVQFAIVAAAEGAIAATAINKLLEEDDLRLLRLAAVQRIAGS